MNNDLQASSSGSHSRQGGVGLVLSGGGAKGAYQAGVLRALNEMAVPIGAVSGASIGALNGAIVAAAPSQAVAADHLQELWTELADIPPLHIGTGLLRVPAYLVVLAAFGKMPGVSGWLSSILRSPAFKNLLASGASTLAPTDEGILSNQRVQKLIDRYIPDGGLPNRLPLYVSVYPTEGVEQDLLRVIGASAGVCNTRDSEFLHVQSLPLAEQKKALLASAALPMLYAPEEIGGKRFSDGGQGGWRTAQGNTPITPLLEAGCLNVVVTHLEDGSFWNRHRFPNATVIEIRPAGKGITRKGAVRDVLGFDNQLSPSWMEQGYEDTVGCIGRIKDTLDAHAELVLATQAMNRSFASTGQLALEDAMRRLEE